MAFPFGFDSRLRQRFLLAIGATGVLAAAGVGCGSKHSDDGGAGRAGGTAAVSGSGTGGGDKCAPERIEKQCWTPQQMQAKAATGCSQIQIAGAQSLPAEQIAAKFLPNGCLTRTAACNGCCQPALEEGKPQADGSCCYTYCGDVCCGRPFIVNDAPQVAAVEARSDWSGPQVRAMRLGPVAERIAAEWLEDARMEHASIASFARFTLDLLAYGAPPEMIEAAQRAGLDECEHAKLCFGLAARFGAGERGPARLMADGVAVAPSLWHAATAAFREGCVNETFAALHAAEACERATDPEVKRALERIAADEADHAELAWRFVTWSAARLGGDFAAHLRREMSALSALPEPRCETEAPEKKQALNAAGRLTATDKRRLNYTAVHVVIAPVLEAVIGRA